MIENRRLVRPQVPPWRELRAHVWWYLLGVVLIGALGGLVWVSVVRLPTFTITSDYRAVPNPESELAAWFAVDAWYCLIGIVVGVGLGLWSWWWFNRTGWLVTVFAIGGTLLAAAVSLRVGLWLGPGSFEVRLTAAQPGDVVPIAFELRSWAAFLLWALAAITPVMLLAAFSSDAEPAEAADAPTMTE